MKLPGIKITENVILLKQLFHREHQRSKHTALMLQKQGRAKIIHLWPYLSSQNPNISEICTSLGNDNWMPADMGRKFTNLEKFIQY